jgi:hypothetical protein
VLESLLVWTENTLDEIGVAIFDELGDLVLAKPENDAVFVVVAFATLREDVATYLGDHKINLRR